jgi:hypothetical protein
LAIELNYCDIRSGAWKLKVLPQHWSGDLWQRVLDMIQRQLPSQHPQTAALHFPGKNNGARLFLKVYHPPWGMSALKDVLRESKAFRSLRKGLELSKGGFLVPHAIAAGEERHHHLLGRAFLLSLEIQGDALPSFLRQKAMGRAGGVALAEKREALDSLARQIRRFHELGFVHGDLVPSNILVSAADGTGLRFHLMDNDRTRRYPAWLPQTIWKRNLVQLNRFPLPGISLQDRMRFFRAYSGRRDWSRGNRTLLRWLEDKTRKRRKECDAVDLNVSFRKLMMWD